MTALIPTFAGLEAVASHLRRSFDEIATVVVERVIDRNTNLKVASIDLSPEALAAFLPHGGDEPASESPAAPGSALVGADAQQEAVLAWLRHTFAANMPSEPSVKFKVGLWTPKREKLVGSVRVRVTGLPPAPEPRPPTARQTWELLLPNGDRVVTSDPEIVEAHRRILEVSVRGMVVYNEQLLTFHRLVEQSEEAERRQLALEEKVRLACGFPPDHDFHPGARSNVLPFHGSPKL